MLAPLAWWISGARVLSTSALAAPIDCDAPVEKDVVDRLLEQAEVAISELDPDALEDAIGRVRLLVRCVEVQLSPAEIARMYRISGIARYVREDLVGSVADFAVARAIEPDAEIDESLGKPLRLNYDAVPPPTGARLPLPRPAGGWLSVDGDKGDSAPADRGYVVQWMDDDGKARGTWLLAVGELAGYPAKGGDAPRSGKDKGGKGKGKGGAGKALLATGATSGALALGGIAGAAVLDSRFRASTAPSSELGGLIAANKALTFGGIGLGAVGAGLLGAGFAVSF